VVAGMTDKVDGGADWMKWIKNVRFILMIFKKYDIWVL